MTDQARGQTEASASVRQPNETVWAGCARHNRFVYGCDGCLIATVGSLINTIADMRKELNMHHEILAVLVKHQSNQQTLTQHLIQ